MYNFIFDIHISFCFTAVGQSNCEPSVPCVFTVGAFCLLRQLLPTQMIALVFQPAIFPGTVYIYIDDYNNIGVAAHLAGPTNAVPTFSS